MKNYSMSILIIFLFSSVLSFRNENISWNISQEFSKKTINVQEKFAEFMSFVDPKAYMEIFELPDYKGKSLKIPYELHSSFPRAEAMQPIRHNILLPFESKKISIRFSHPQLMAYIKLDEKNPIIVHSDLRSYVFPSKMIKSIVVDHKTDVQVSLEAILSEIHNNDCRRMYGSIAVELYIKNGMGGECVGLLVEKNKLTTSSTPWVTTINPNPVVTPQLFETNTNFRYFLFSQSKSIVESGNLFFEKLFDINAYFTPLNTSKPYLNNPNSGFSPFDYHFVVGSEAIKNSSVYLKIRTELGSAHKGCDLCTDFTWEAKMTGPDIKLIKLDKLKSGIQGQTHSGYFVGNYRSNTNKAGNFTGPQHSTYLQFGASHYAKYLPRINN